MASFTLRSTTVSCVAAVVLGCATVVHAAARPSVVELFTSEGCSSCPPAEAYIGELAHRPNILALAFHVDYWDDLGWRDRFGLPQSVQRQRTYAKALGLATVYTPQVVLDGRSDFVGSNVTAINQRLKEDRSGVAVMLEVQNGQIQVDLGSLQEAAASDVILVAYQRRAVSAIGRGENAGRTLAEFNIVRSIQVIGSWHGRMVQFHAAVGALPAESTDVAVLVQAVGQGPIIGAATLPLTGF